MEQQIDVSLSVCLKSINKNKQQQQQHNLSDYIFRFLEIEVQYPGIEGGTEQGPKMWAMNLDVVLILHLNGEYVKEIASSVADAKTRQAGKTEKTFWLFLNIEAKSFESGSSKVNCLVE